MLGPRGFSGLCFAILLFCACEDRATKTRRVPETYTLVPGTPRIDTGIPRVAEDPTRETQAFRASVARQCDRYEQLPVRKVDILWVVDSSASMAPKQARLGASFTGFVNELVAARPPVDFHVGVVTTDTDDPGSRGILRGWHAAGTAGDFLACTPNPTGVGTSCNVGTGSTAEAVAAFQDMVKVGTDGSSQERGLLAAYLALTNLANQTGGFLRPDASLYVVVVSDEDDASCNPLVVGAVCTTDPGCRCAPDAVLESGAAFGSTRYFSRFLESFKGFGNEDFVALGAIVALDGSPDASVPSQYGDLGVHVGCCRLEDGGVCPSGSVADGTQEIAYFGDRYARVAAATGGAAISVCQEDFSGALAALGYAASGLRREFKLSRGPDPMVLGDVAKGISLFVSPPTAGTCVVDGNCLSGEVCRTGRCSRRVPVSVLSTAEGAQYVKCDAQAFRNVIRFGELAVPLPLSAVEVCYDVEEEFQPTCQ